MSTTTRYFDLTIPAPKRLAMMREAVATYASKYPNYPDTYKPKTWRDIRRTTHKSIAAYTGALSQGFNGTDNHKTPVWYCHTGEQFRHEKFAKEFANRWDQFPGYYTDVHASETTQGIVAMLPHGRFIAGYHWDANGERVYFPEVFDDEYTAASAADSHAESFADSCREDSEQYEAARELETTIKDSLRRLAECVALRNKKCMAYVRNEISQLIEEIRDSRETLRTEYADYI